MKVDQIEPTTLEFYINNIDFRAALQFNSINLSNQSFDNSETEFMLPPNTKHPPGRPKKYCIHTRTESSEAPPTQVQKCDCCRQFEHSIRIYKEVI